MNNNFLVNSPIYNIKVSAIIAEYNPFHNGHLQQINYLKKMGSTHIIAIMSGNYVQRGDVAIFSKKSRTQLALLNGVDLIIEIPVEHSLACAEIFARSSVFLANSLACVNSLCFGCENPDVDKLKLVSKIIHSPNISHLTKKYLAHGMSFPSAKAKAISELYPGIDPDFYSKPNNILAMEYLHSLEQLNSNITPIATPREVQHDSIQIKNSITTAMHIRNLILENNPEYKNYIPKTGNTILEYDIINKLAPTNISNLERAILYHLRKSDPSGFKETPDIGSEGLENRILSSAKTATSFENLLFLIKTKRYSLSRLRRIVLTSFLGITSKLQQSLPKYIKILGFSKNGEALLKIIKSESSLPIVIRYSDIHKLNSEAKKSLSLNLQTDNIFFLSSPQIRPCNSEIEDFPVKSL